MNKQLKMILEN